MLQGEPSLRVDFAQTMGAPQSRHWASNGLRSVFSVTREAYPTGLTTSTSPAAARRGRASRAVLRRGPADAVVIASRR